MHVFVSLTFIYFDYFIKSFRWATSIDIAWLFCHFYRSLPQIKKHLLRVSLFCYQFNALYWFFGKASFISTTDYSLTMIFSFYKKQYAFVFHYSFVFFFLSVKICRGPNASVPDRGIWGGRPKSGTFTQKVPQIWPWTHREWLKKIRSIFV